MIDGEKLLILTNYHVIHDATKIYVRLPGDKGSYADIHAADPQRDLAVLSLLDKSIKPLKPVKFGNGGDAKKGQFVVAIANPYASGFRDGSPSASWGIVSNIQRRAAANANEAAGTPLSQVQKDEGLTATFTVSTFIQTDAQILPGSSGGALVNLKGEVIGMLSARAGLSGMEGVGGFAMPIDKGAKRIIEQLLVGKEFQHGFLGITPDYDARSGEGGSCGQRDLRQPSPTCRPELARLHCGREWGPHSRLRRSGLGGELPARRIGSPVRASRSPSGHCDGKTNQDIHPWNTGKQSPETGTRHSRRLPKCGRDRTRRKVQQPPILSPRGVGVSEVQSGSHAEEARLSVGDIIYEVNGQIVSEPDEFYKAASKVPADKTLVLTVGGARGTQRIEVP